MSFLCFPRSLSSYLTSGKDMGNLRTSRPSHRASISPFTHLLGGVPSLHCIYSNNMSPKDARPSRSPLGFEPTVPQSRGNSNLRLRLLRRPWGDPMQIPYLNLNLGRRKGATEACASWECWRPSSPWSLAAAGPSARGRETAFRAWLRAAPAQGRMICLLQRRLSLHLVSPDSVHGTGVTSWIPGYSSEGGMS